MSFELVAPGDEPSNGASGSRRRARSDVPKDARGDEISPFPETPDQVAYYHPKGCGEAGDPECTPERIKAICHNNKSKTDDAEAFPIDGVFFGQRIRPPFLKGVNHGEKIDDDGNTFVDGKTRRTDDGKENNKGTGACFNDDDEEDGLREWTEKEMRDPTNRNEIVFLSRATTARQSVRPKFAAAIEAVLDDLELRRLLDDDDTYQGMFFRSTTLYLPDPDDPDGVRTEEDTILASAQELAVACGARVPSNLSDEEKTVFEAFKREKFDDLWSRSSLRRRTSNRSRSRSMLDKLMEVARATGFAHGEAKIQRRLDEILPTEDEMVNAARRGDSAVLKRLLDSAKVEDVGRVSAKLFAEALDGPASNVETIGVLVAHDKVDVNAALTEYYGEFSEGDGPLRMAIAGANPKSKNFLALLKHPKIDVNRRSNGLTTLWALACIDYRERSDWRRWGSMFEALLAHKKTIVDATNDDGGTALHAACLTDGEIFSVRDEFVVRMLLDAGANPLAKKRNGHTPVDEARARQNFALADLLTVAVPTNTEMTSTRSRRNDIDEARARLRRGTVRAWLEFDKEPQTMVFDAKGELSVGFKSPKLGTQEFGKTQGVIRLDADTGLRVGHLLPPRADQVPEWKGRETHMLESSFSSNGERVALYGDMAYQHAQIYGGNKFEAECLIGVDEEDSGGISSVTFDGNGEMLAGVFDPYLEKTSTFSATVKIWRRDKNGRWGHMKTLNVDHAPSSVAFSPDGTRLAMGSSVSTRVWTFGDQTTENDTKEVTAVGNLSVPPYSTYSPNTSASKVSFSADGERLGILRETFMVLESTNGDVPWENARSVMLPRSSESREIRRVKDFAFNPQNSTLLALVVGRNVELWSTYREAVEVPDGTMLRRFKNVKGPLAFSPDGTRLAMVSREDGSIVVENIVETFAEAFLENEKTRQTIDVVDGPTREHLEILKHARDVEIRVVLANDTLWKLGAFLPNLERLTFKYFDFHTGRLEIGDFDLASLVSLKKLILPLVRLKTIPSSIAKIRSLRELDVMGNGISALPDDLEQLRALRYIDLSHNYFKEFPKVLERMPSLRLIRILDNEDENGETLIFPSTQFSEALRDKMNKRLLRIDQGRGHDGRGHDIRSELVWGFDGETECEIPSRLTNDEVRERLRARDERPKVTHAGTQVLAFLLARYDRRYDKSVEKVLSEYFGLPVDDSDFAVWSAFKETRDQIMTTPIFRTVGGVDGILSAAGVEEFWKWFVSDDFDRDMRAFARHVAEPDFNVNGDEIDRVQILKRLGENGFVA